MGKVTGRPATVTIFWIPGSLKGKSESFRLRFVLFAIIRSADFPLLSSSPAHFFHVLGQRGFCNHKLKWSAFGLEYFQVTNAETHDHKRSFEKLRR